MMIKKDSLYLFRHNSNVWIVEGKELEYTVMGFEQGNIIVVDINGNFYKAKYQQNDHVSYQELYKKKLLNE